jgi:hypothetical protein
VGEQVWTLGLDIGRDGAAVLLHGRLGNDVSAVAGVHWKQHIQGGEKVIILRGVSTVQGVAPFRRDGLVGGWSLGECLQEYFGRWAMLAGNRINLAAEDIYVGENPRTAVEIAKFGGSIVSRLEPWSPVGGCSWVKPPMWRKPILGIPMQTRREVAKAASLGMMPKLVRGLSALQAGLGLENDHLTDAAGVASWMVIYGPRPA